MNQKVKWAIAFLSILILAMSIEAALIHAVTTAPSTLTISSGIYPAAPHYVVWVESSVYYVKDQNGLTVLSVTNATEAIQYAINLTTATTPSGGEVFVKSGSYVGASVTVKDNVYLILDSGVGTVVYTPTTSGTCTIEDRMLWKKLVYLDGNLVYSIDSSAGQHSYSYLIYQDGTFYYLKNGTTGAIDYSSTNASAVFQSAFDSLTSGGEVFVKAGTYVLTTQIIIEYDGIELVGEGFYKTILSYSTTSGYFMAIRHPVSGTSNARIRGIHLSNFMVRDTNTHNIAHAGIYIQGAQELTIDNLMFFYAANCITFDCSNATRPNRGGIFIHDIYFDECDGYMIADSYYDGVATEIKMDRIFITEGSADNMLDGIVFNNTVILYASQIDIDGPNRWGLYLNYSFGSTISDFWIEDVQRNYISGSRTRLTNGYITNNQYEGLWAYGMNQSIIANCVFTSNSAATNDTYSALNLTNCINTIITNSQFQSITEKWSIVEGGISDNNIITGSIMADYIITVGIDTHTNLCWNVTSWVA